MDRERENVLSGQTVVPLENTSVALEEAYKSVRTEIDLCSEWL